MKNHSHPLGWQHFLCQPLIQMLWTSKIGSKKAMVAFAGLRPSSEKAEDSIFLKELFEVYWLGTVHAKRLLTST